MLGAIIGDIVGSRFEFSNHKSKEFELFTAECFVTDDSIMSLAVAKAIMETEYCIEPEFRNTEYDFKYNDLLRENTIKWMRILGHRYPGCGFGNMFSQWMTGNNPKPYGSYGNGAAMRISPVGHVARTEEDVSVYSEIVTSVTHDHIEGIKGANAVATSVFMALNGCLKKEIFNRINMEYYPLDFTIDSIRDSYSFDETCQGTVPQAIQCFMESESFEDAIRLAISLGGDSDTVAAITGSIAGAYYGIPEEIKKKALTYLDEDLLAIYNEWEEFIAEEEYRFRFLTKFIQYFAEGYDETYEFLREIYQFAKAHPKYKMLSYREVLSGMGFEPDKLRIEDIRIEDIDDQGTLSLIMFIVRMDRFCEGILFEYIRNGTVTRLLKHLVEMDRKEKNLGLAEILLRIMNDRGCISHHYIVSDKKILKITSDGYKPDTHRTFSFEESNRFLSGWNHLHTEYWKQSYSPGDLLFRTDGTDWLLYERYIGHRGKIKTGYIEFPDNWEALRELLCLDKENIRKPGDMIFCMVSFSEDGNTYYYLTEDEEIQPGDRVTVPVGPDNTEKTAYVETVEYHKPKDAPYPLNKTKYILGKTTGTDEMGTDAQNMTLYSHSGANGSTVVWARIKDGCLEIEQQDLGPYLPYTDGEHETFYSFDSMETKRFSMLLTDQSDDLELFLKMFALKIKGPGWYDELMFFCKRHSLKYSMFGC